ncbi:HEAT repeat domain-containing protein [bacterium]|nr:HEAT repeat domain-containing protein [bacterium]
MNHQHFYFKPTCLFTVVWTIFFLFFSLTTTAAPSKDKITLQYHQWLEMKDKAIPELKKAIFDANWRIRTHALLAMGKTGDQTLVPVILKKLEEDPHLSVKNCAVIALKTLKARQAVPILINMLQEQLSGNIRVKTPTKLLIQALGEIGDPRATDILYQYLFIHNQTERIAATEALIAIKDESVSTRILDEQIRFKTDSRTKEAAMILGEIPVPGAESFLLEIVTEKDRVAGTAAIVSLGKIKSKKAIPILLTGLQKESGQHQAKIAEALIAIDSPEAVDPLCLIIKDNGQEVAMKAASVLARMTEPSISFKVFKLFNSNQSVNEPAAYVLGFKKYRGAVPLIRERLKDETQPGQDQLAKSLGWLDDFESVALLIEVAQRSSQNGSLGAAAALGDLKAVKAVPTLIDLLGTNNKQLLAQVVVSLGNIEDQRAANPLIKLSYETGSRFTLLIAEALGKISGDVVFKFIQDSIASGDKERLRIAAYTLRHYKVTETQVPYFKSLLEHNNASVSKAAHQVLRRIADKD